MSVFSFELRGLNPVQGKLRRLIAYFTNLRPVLQQTQKDFAEMMDTSFNSGGPPGQKWAKHSKYTEVARSQRKGTYASGGSGSKILVWSGGLQRSFSGTGSNSIYKISASGQEYELRMGSAHPRAKLLNDGATFRRGPVTAKSGGGGFLKKLLGKKRKGNGRFIAFYNRNGQLVITRRSAGCTITIPPRSFWTEEQSYELMNKNEQRMRKEVEEIWNG